LFHVLWKATIAQMQMCGAAQTEFVICDQSIDTNHGYHKTPVENPEEARETGGPGKAAGKSAAVGRWSEEAFAQCQ
jgi:hypothetical protein